MLSITPDKTTYKEGETVIFTITKPLLAKVHFYIKGPGLSVGYTVRGISPRKTFKWTIPKNEIWGPWTGTYMVVDGVAYFLGGILPKIVVGHAPETSFEVV